MPGMKYSLYSFILMHAKQDILFYSFTTAVLHPLVEVIILKRKGLCRKIKDFRGSKILPEKYKISELGIICLISKI